MTEKVRDQIMRIRDSGATNMLAVNAVQRIAYERGFFDLVNYIEDNRKGYVHFIFTGEEE
ncbi:MAG: DUF5049 domain-containing protein [Clostridia bacterium]|nr:DUF5049 domain-containing protein [Clostridia bacterium]